MGIVCDILLVISICALLLMVYACLTVASDEDDRNGNG